MKILFLLNDIPYPPNTGTRNKVFNIISHISGKHECEVLSLAYGCDSEKRVGAFLKELPKVKVIAFPPYERGGIFFIKAMLNLLSLKPIFVARHNNAEFTVFLKETLAKNDYDLIHYDTVGMAQYVKYAGKTPGILSVHDSPYMVYKSAARSAFFLFRPFILFYSYFVGFYEQRNYRFFDGVHLVSEADVQFLPERIKKEANFIIIPIAVPGEIVSSPVKQPAEGNQIVVLFSGNLKYKGISEGLFEFLEKGYPRLKGMGLKMRIIGRLPFAAVANKIARDESIEYLEWAEDYQKALDEAHICIFTDKFGTGIKTRVLYAMSRGKPVIATAYALSGIKGRNGEHFFICDDYAVMAEKVKDLMGNRVLREKVGDNSRRLIISEYNVEYIGENWENLYLNISKKIK